MTKEGIEKANKLSDRVMRLIAEHQDIVERYKDALPVEIESIRFLHKDGELLDLDISDNEAVKILETIRESRRVALEKAQKEFDEFRVE